MLNIAIALLTSDRHLQPYCPHLGLQPAKPNTSVLRELAIAVFNSWVLNIFKAGTG
ncbi:hypothetical protein H6G00_09560 [Leptolyngbya sp. FACHB-541]|uniref:hypothetical protein n=1 Tax=Leptolyngbya sp. FACHB-541 TaxID=2692810 RepID=UPI0016853741|nr:hypothetical protein [Leptolyngbya sp. FACHB-541]MBD1996864.1 hypothetical protein [Leptolyngbya sp. FACHB-541]